MTIYSIFQFRNQGGRLAFFQFYLFVYLVVLGLHCWVGFSLVVVSGGYSLVSVTSLVADHGLCMHGLQQLWCTGLVVSQHVGSSRIRDRNRVSFIGRWILYHWATREAPYPTPLQLYSLLSRIPDMLSPSPVSTLNAPLPTPPVSVVLIRAPELSSDPDTPVTPPILFPAPQKHPHPAPPHSHPKSKSNQVTSMLEIPP